MPCVLFQSLSYDAEKKMPFKNRYSCIVPFESRTNKAHNVFGSTESTNVLKRSINIQICVRDDTGIVQIRQNYRFVIS